MSANSRAFGFSVRCLKDWYFDWFDSLDTLTLCHSAFSADGIVLLPRSSRYFLEKRYDNSRKIKP
jgi:hypothetical protein